MKNSMDAVIVRPVTTQDFNAIFILLQHLWPTKELNKQALLTIFTRCVDSSDYQYLCAEIGGTVVGFCSLEIRNSLWQEGYLGYIGELVVDESIRGQGVGTELISAAIDNAKDRGCNRIELDSAFHREEAHQFYQRMGFKNRAYIFTKEL